MASKNQKWVVLGGAGVVLALVYEYFQHGSSGLSAKSNSSVVQTGDILKYSAEINTSFFSSIADALASISATLSSQGLTVTNSQNNASLLQTLESAITLSGQTTGITLEIEVENSGYGSATDVQSICDNAVYQASGSMPLSSSIAFSSQKNPASQGAESSNLQTGGLTGFFAQFGAGAATGILLAVAGIVGLVVVSKEIP